ncbi:MAG TPA: transcription termination factor NusA [Patescibacteria group bacterium]|nr:transcription termination factor NusA [Patescibacteria group bacterium]
MQSSIVAAIKQICNEKGISYESVIETLNAALAAAFRKDFGQKNQNIKVEFDPETGLSRAFDVKTVVSDELAEITMREIEQARLAAEQAKAAAGTEGESTEEVPMPEEETKREFFSGSQETDEEGEDEKRFNPKTDITLSDAKDIKPDAQLDDEIKIELEIPGEFGRMAAQTAKQVITQRLREAERETIFHDFKDAEHTVITGVVQRVEGNNVLIDLGRTTAIMLPDGQIPRERYKTGDRVRLYVSDVRMSSKGPEIIVSRTSPEIVRELFVTEIPEVANGSIEIKAIAREAGSRSKVAVFTEQENIEPIGSCVGQRGTRVQTIISELSGEKLDIIEYSDDTAKFVSNALLPAKVSDIEIRLEEKIASVRVEPDQLSLAIGKGGQNVRLAAKLTGWKINIAETKEAAKPSQDEKQESGTVANSANETADEADESKE